MTTQERDRSKAEQEHFDRLVKETGETWWGNMTPAGRFRMRRKADLLLQKARLTNTNPVMLEIGCGIGTFTKYLLEKDADLQILAGDVSPEAIAYAQNEYASYANVEFQTIDATHLQFDDNSFDSVIGNSILHHIPMDVCLSEFYRVLKPGGSLWFSEPNMLNPQVLAERKLPAVGRRLQVSEDETAFVRWDLHRVLESGGFSDVRIRPFDFVHPITPSVFIQPLRVVGSIIERIPILREFSGSLEIVAKKST